jgi:hypothetical protein
MGHRPLHTTLENRPQSARQSQTLWGQADARTRTGDPFITSEVLYQLSYVGGVCKLPAKRDSLPRGHDDGLRTEPIPCTPGAHGPHPAARFASARVP